MPSVGSSEPSLWLYNLMKKIINITEITEYLYCPRKLFLKLKGIREAPNQKMILGMLRHKALDIFNRQEKVLVSSIREKLEEKEVKRLYDELIRKIVSQVYSENKSLSYKFSISEKEFSDSVDRSITPEIHLRVDAILRTLEKNFLGAELWRNLKPKYLTELKLESEELGLRGRVDRVKIGEEIIPFEIKTREKIFESDKIQLAGYSLLLEKEFNKPINRGIVEILGKQQEIEIGEELKNRVLEIAEKIRNLTEETASFPNNFQMCQSCSLNEICSSK